MSSPQGQSSTELLCAAAFLVLASFLVWRGWRLGMVRMLVSIGAVVGGYFIGAFGGPLLAPLLRPTGYPDPLLALGGGAAIGLAFYVSARLVGAILFKRTAQQSFTPLRWLFGVLGAAIGVVEATALLLVLAMSVRVGGIIAESAGPAWQQTGLVNLKQKLEDGALGDLVKSLDPIPPDYYRMIGGFTGLLSNPRELAQFLASPAAKEIDHKPLEALQNDPRLNQQLQSGRLVELLKNPKIVGLLNDPKVRQALGNIEWHLPQKESPPNKPKPRSY